VHRNYLILFALLFLFYSYTPIKQFQKDFIIQQLAPNVWAAINNDKGGHAICNAGIIDLGDKTIVFDAFINPDAAFELKHTAESLTKHPVTFVINSHFHDDHTQGNQSFVPGASIISTVWTRNEIARAEPENLFDEKKNIETVLQKAKHEWQIATGIEKEEDLMWVGYYEAIAQALPKIKITLPGITFKDSLWIYGSKSSAVLYEVSGHTNSDVVMVLPKEKIAFMGDILFTERHPYLGDGDPENWKKSLDRFYSDSSIKTYVPGHGEIAGKEELQILIQYINKLEQLSANAVTQNLPDSVFEKTAIPIEYKNWWFARFYTDNLSFLYERAKKK